jgi:hypothetical protein
MHSKDFFRSRRDELRKFFELRFGFGWRTKLASKTGAWLNVQPNRVAKAEELARLYGFVPSDERATAQALERNFFRRLRLVSETLRHTPMAVCQNVTLGDCLNEFFAYRPHRAKYKQKHKDAYSDVFSPDNVVIEPTEPRTISPTSGPSPGPGVPCWKPYEEWLSIPIGEPPGCPGPEGVATGGPTRSVTSARFVVNLVWKIRAINGWQQGVSLTLRIPSRTAKTATEPLPPKNATK